MAIKSITINGTKFRSINEACKFNGVKKATYSGRRNRGWGIIKSITTKTIKKKDQKTNLKRIRFSGKSFPSLKALCKFKGVPYHTFHARQKKGLSIKDSLNNERSGMSGPPPKSVKERILECKINLKNFAEKENINEANDWYKIKLKKLDKVVSTLKKFKKISTIEILRTIYPKKKFLPWLFAGKGKKVPKDTWSIKENRVNYIKWLKRYLKLKKLSSFYKLMRKDYNHNYGTGLLGSINPRTKKQFTVLELLSEAYPKYAWIPWLFEDSPNKFWQDKKNHKLFFDWVLKKQKIKVTSKKIYNLNSTKFKELGGANILNFYDNFFNCLESIYPKIKFDRFKFFHKGRGFWEDRENHKLAIQHLGKELGIKKCNDWYTVMYDDFEEAGIISVLGFQEYKGSYAKCIIKNLPKCKLNESKFDRSFKYEYRARRFAVCIYGERNVIKNHHPKFLNGLELDISIPKKNLAIEYNGKQHYIYIPHFHRNRKNFLNSLANDKKKIELSAKNNVNLIVIKYNEWDGFPKSFLNIIQNKFGLSKTERSNFWRRFKKDDLYPEVMLELKKKG